MSVKLIPVGMLKKYLEGRDSLILEDRAGQPVAELLAALNIPSQLVAIVLVNGRQVAKNYVLRDGDVVKLAPFIGGGCYGRREEKTDYRGWKLYKGVKLNIEEDIAECQLME